MCLRFQFEDNTYPPRVIAYDSFIRTNKAWKATPPKRKTGYKIFTKINNEIESFHFYFKYEKDVWYTAINKIIEDSQGKEYKTGFHIFRTPKCAKLYMSTYVPDILIAKVEYDEILTTGCELVVSSEDYDGLIRYVTAPVIVANKMRIIGEI